MFKEMALFAQAAGRPAGVDLRVSLLSPEGQTQTVRMLATALSDLPRAIQQTMPGTAAALAANGWIRELAVSAQRTDLHGVGPCTVLFFHHPVTRELVGSIAKGTTDVVLRVPRIVPRAQVPPTVPEAAGPIQLRALRRMLELDLTTTEREIEATLGSAARAGRRSGVLRREKYSLDVELHPAGLWTSRRTLVGGFPARRSIRISVCLFTANPLTGRGELRSDTTEVLGRDEAFTWTVRTFAHLRAASGASGTDFQDAIEIVAALRDAREVPAPGHQFTHRFDGGVLIVLFDWSDPGRRHSRN